METARKVFTDHEPTDRERNIGKRGMFAYAYGAGVPVFSKSVGLARAQGEEIYKAIGALYPGLRQGMADTTREVRETAGESEYGYIVLTDGRHLRVPTNRAYKGFNFKIQGDCAVILKEALVNLSKVGLSKYVRLLVHDEIIFSVPDEELVEVVPEIERTMTRDDYTVPLTCSAKIASSWGEPIAQKELAAAA